MTKEELIHQVLSETNIDLYNFWATKLLTEYPEYKQIMINNWNYSVNSKRDYSTALYLDDDKNLSNGEDFQYTFSSELEWEGLLNWTLRKEGYD